MAIPVFAGKGTLATDSGTGSITITLETNIVSGDLIILAAANDKTSGIPEFNAVTGYTLLKEHGDAVSDSIGAAYWRVSDGTEAATIDITYTNSGSIEAIANSLRITGADTTNPIDVIEFDGTVDGGGDLTIGQITTGGINTLVIGVATFDGGDGHPATISGTGWALIESGQESTSSTTIAYAICEKDVASVGVSGSPIVVWNVSDGSGGFLFAIAEPRAAGTGAWIPNSITRYDHSGEDFFQGKSYKSHWWNSYKSRWDGLIPYNESGFLHASGDHYIATDLTGTVSFAVGASSAEIELEDRSSGRPTCYWDDAGKKLYVASFHDTTSEYWEISYNSTTDEYSFTVGSAGAGETITGMDRDGSGAINTGSIYVVPNGDVWVALLTLEEGLQLNRRNGGSWGTMMVLDATLEEGIAVLAHFVDGGTTNVYVFSAEDESAANSEFNAYFIDQDHASPLTSGNWTEDTVAAQTLFSEDADNHIDLVKDDSENIYIVIKAAGSTVGHTNIGIIKRTPTGTYSGEDINTTPAASADSKSRPCIAYDKTNDKLYVAFGRQGADDDTATTYVTADLSDLTTWSSETDLFNHTDDCFANLRSPQQDFQGTDATGLLFTAPRKKAVGSAFDDDIFQSLITITGGGSDASGQVVLPQITINGIALTTYDAIGTPAMPQVVIAGIALTAYDADGQISLPIITINGIALAEHIADSQVILPQIITGGDSATEYIADAQVVLPSILPSGIALVAYNADGQTGLPIISVNGIASGVVTFIADGQVDLPIIAINGLADTLYTADSQVTLPQITTNGLALATYDADGQPTMPQITINGLAAHIFDGIGDVTLPIIVISGFADTEYAGIGMVDLPIIAIGGNADILYDGFGTIDLSIITLDGVASWTISGDAIGDVQLPIITTNGIALIAYDGIGAAILPGIIINGDSDGGGVAAALFSKSFTSEFTTDFTIH